MPRQPAHAYAHMSSAQIRRPGLVSSQPSLHKDVQTQDLLKQTHTLPVTVHAVLIVGKAFAVMVAACETVLGQVWDPDALADTSPGALHHRHPLTPYADLSLYGRVVATFVRGQQVFAGSGGKDLDPGHVAGSRTGSGLAARACGRALSSCAA